MVRENLQLPSHSGGGTLSGLSGSVRSSSRCGLACFHLRILHGNKALAERVTCAKSSALSGEAYHELATLTWQLHITKSLAEFSVAGWQQKQKAGVFPASIHLMINYRRVPNQRLSGENMCGARLAQSSLSSSPCSKCFLPPPHRAHCTEVVAGARPGTNPDSGPLVLTSKLAQ